MNVPRPPEQDERNGSQGLPVGQQLKGEEESAGRRRWVQREAAAEVAGATQGRAAKGDSVHEAEHCLTVHSCLAPVQPPQGAERHLITERARLFLARSFPANDGGGNRSKERKRVDFDQAGLARPAAPPAHSTANLSRPSHRPRFMCTRDRCEYHAHCRLSEWAHLLKSS